MALQGTLDTFALPDVLRLLAATKKTGRLWVSGGRGNGSVWVDQGAVVATDAPAAGSDKPGDVVFELLRFAEGSFSFEADTKPAKASAPSFVEPLLAEAEERLKEWQLIEAVVPSLDAWVTLAPEIADDEVSIDAECWRGIVAVAGGSTVGQVGDTLGLSEVPVSRRIKELVELGLVIVDAEAPAAPPAAGEPAVDEPVETASPEVFVEPAAAAGDVFDPRRADDRDTFSEDRYTSSAASPFEDDSATSSLFGTSRNAERGSFTVPAFEEFEPITRTSGAGSSSPFGSRDSSSEGGPVTPLRSYEPFESSTPAPSTLPAGRGHEAADPALDDGPNDDEVVRQLASLSPRAARAVAAAARAETEEERDAALAEVTADGEEPINRGLLLKFLSSVKQ